MTGILLTAVLVCALIFTQKRKTAEHGRVLETQKRNESLSLALEAAQQAEVARSVFLSRVSHEMRTPLNAITGYMELAGETESPDEVRDYLAKTRTAADQLLSTINEMLDTSALQSGKMKLTEEPFELRAFCVSILNIFSGQARLKGIAFEITPENITDEHLLGDVQHLGQIIINLVSNAIKFTDTGGRVTLRISQRSDAESVLTRFEVRDNGIGMEPDYVDKIWQPFSQESADIGKKYGGSGLGMPIVKMLTELMRGEITVETKKGEGTTFIVELPLKSMGMSESADKTADMRALVVGGGADDRKNYRALFQAMGAKDEYAVSSGDALPELQKAKREGAPYSVCIVNWDDAEKNCRAEVDSIRKNYDGELFFAVVTAFDCSTVPKGGRPECGALVQKPVFGSTLRELFALAAGSCGQPKSAKKIGSVPDFSERRALLVDDNKMNLEIAAKMLKKTGMEVICAKDGRDALKKYLELPEGALDIVLMDVQMPEMDGYEATAAIRKSARSDALTTPVFAMTADAFSEDVANAKEAGMNGHIAKPIDYAALYGKLDGLFCAKSQNDGKEKE